MNQKFGYEIAQGLVNHLMYNLKLEKLSAYVTVENRISIKILEKVGFIQVQLAANGKQLEYKYELHKINIFRAYKGDTVNKTEKISEICCL